MRSDHRLRLPLLVLGLALGARFFTIGDGPVGSLAANVAAALEKRTGARVASPEAEVFVLGDAPSGVFASASTVRFVALATPPGGVYRDLYRLEARVAGNGGVVELGWAVNLTRSSAADDAQLFVDGERVATVVRAEGGALAALELRDFGGDSSPAVAAWPWLQRLMAGVTNVEQTGAWEGVALAHYDVSEALAGAEVRRVGDRLTVGEASLALRGTSGAGAGVDCLGEGGGRDPSDGSRCLLHLSPTEERMQMDLLNWVADRGRGFADQGLAPAWLGSSVELAKEVYFQAKEVKAAVEELGPEPEEVAAPTPAAVAAQETAIEEATERARRQTETSDFPWPPPPIPALLSPALEGEGLWTPLPSGWSDGRDAVPLVYTSFIRPSSEYAKKAVRLFVWDPRRAELAMRAGTHEPVPQTAVKGDGRIPRDPALLERVVLAFNGGFQTTHRAFGMMVDDRVLLKPRTYGATIATLEDGRPAIGTWAKGAAIPEEFVSFRQNLEPLIEDGAFNAYRRVRFGAHENVAGAKDGWTVRSALCQSPEGHLLYAYAEYTNERALALALKQARCVYAIHLDMNPGHTGIERYRHLGSGAEPEVPENLREVEGVRLEGFPGHPNVRHMNRPTRYLATDYRDFFYLVRSDVLPGPPLGELTPAAGDGDWLTDRLPQNPELPPRVAVAALGDLTIVQMDLAATTLAVGTSPPSGAAPMLSVPLRCQGERPLDLVGARAAAAAPAPLALSGGPASSAATALIAAGSRREAAGVGPGHRADRRVAVVLGVTPERFALAESAVQALGLELVAGCEVPGSGLPTVWAYDRDPSGRLIEIVPGDEHGVVVQAPTTHDERLWISPAARPARVVRYWPDANPYRKAP